jgi:hypothetical protein
MLITQICVAATPYPFKVFGNYLRIKRMTGSTAESISVEFWKNNKKLPIDLTNCDPGDYARIDGGYDEIILTSSTSQTVYLQSLSGDVSSGRITGEVLTINGEIVRTKNNQAFMGYAAVAAVAAQFSHLQLWNPSANYNLLVNQVSWYTTTGTAVQIKKATTSLVNSFAAQPNPLSKNYTGANSIAQNAYENNAAGLGTAMCQISMTPAVQYTWKFTEPVLLAQNRGLTLQNMLVNDALVGHWEFIQEPV